MMKRSEDRNAFARNLPLEFEAASCAPARAEDSEMENFSGHSAGSVFGVGACAPPLPSRIAGAGLRARVESSAI